MRDPSLEIRAIATPDDLYDPHLKKCFSWWNTARAAGMGPQAMDFLEVPEVVENASTCRFEPGQALEEAVINFGGNAVAIREGTEVRGMKVGIFRKYPVTYQLIEECFQAKRPVVVGPHQSTLDENIHWYLEQICLPLSDKGDSLDGMCYVVKILPPDFR